jgi:Protein of unknown function (DUF551)
MTMQWISVKDKLPEEFEEVLVIRTDMPNLLGYKIDYVVKYPDNSETPYIWARTLSDEWEKVTHWMPLPEGPNF